MSILVYNKTTLIKLFALMVNFHRIICSKVHHVCTYDKTSNIYEMSIYIDILFFLIDKKKYIFQHLLA